MKLGWIVTPLAALAAITSVTPAMFGCGTRSAPNPFVLDAGPDGGGGAGGDLDPGDAGPAVDPTLGGPCVDDGQCHDEIDCTSDKCDLALQRCRFLPDDAPCQNAVYCDGRERCDNKLGCIAGVPVGCEDGTACTIDACDEATHTCKHAARDADLDGDPDIHCPGGGDCDDADPSVSSKTAEICGNAVDDNCNGVVDEAPCAKPSHDTCKDPLEITASGSYAMDTTGSAFDYATSCGLGSQPGTADVVAALVLAAGPPVDVEITARSLVPSLSVAIAGQCGDAASELACSGSSPATGGGQLAKLLARSIGSPTKPTALPIYIATQPPSAIVLDVQLLPPSVAPLNETCGAAAPIDLGVPFSASIFDAVKDLDSACLPPLGELVYSFTLAAPSDVDIYASSTDGDGLPAISLRGAGCALLSDELGCQAASANAHLFRHAIPSGTYYIAISASAPTTVLVTVEAKPPTVPPADETCSGAPLLAANKTIAVPLAAHQDDIGLGCLSGAVDAAYALALPVASDVLLVERIGQGDTGGVELSQPACSGPSDLLACGTGAPSPVRASKRNVPAGDYRVVVETLQGADAEVTALVRPAVATTLVPFADACADVLPIPKGGGFFQGNTANNAADFVAGCDLNNGGPAGAPDQLLELVLDATKRVVLDMGGSAYTTLLDVRKGPECPGEEVTFGCAVGFSQARSYLDLTLDAGTYYLQIDGYAGDKGAWSLDVRVVDP